MRLLSLLVLAAATFTNAQTTPSFCQYYTKAIFNDTSLSHQFDLISAVVGRTILGCNSVDATKSAGGTCTGAPAGTIVIGLLDAGSSNANFFDGTGPMTGSAATLTGSQAKNAAKSIAPGANGATVFANISATTKLASPNPSSDFLIGHLVEWFGKDLGCDLNTTAAIGASSEATGIARYGGISDMTALHKDMVINKTVWTGFATALISTLKSFGVPQTGTPGYDIDSAIVPYASGFLRSTTGTKSICNQADCDAAPTAAPGSTTAPPTGTPAPGATTQPPTATPAPKKNNTATAVAASPAIIMGAAVVLTMLF